MHALFAAPLCLTALFDVGLCVSYDHADSAARSRCLTQMSRRGGPVIVSFLTRMHDELRGEQANGRAGRDRSTVELLTALRRVQGKSDPLTIVTGAPDEVESIFPNLPAVDVALVNRDVQKVPVRFTEGGDYRGGRQDRWRLNVRDAHGKVMPVRPRLSGTGGGIYRMGILEHEQSWETTLLMRSFIELPPGDYTVVVEYHDEQTISDLQDTAGVLVCRSEPFKLHVQPRVVDVTARDREIAKEAIAALAGRGEVQILTGTYGKDAHDFIRPDSAAGRLLALGWRAVPVLLDALDDDKVTDQQRARAFALLYSITGWNDPRSEDGVLSSYESRGGGWVVGGGRNRRDFEGGIGLGSSESRTGGKLDGAAQRAFAKKWKAFREYLVVREKR